MSHALSFWASEENMPGVDAGYCDGGLTIADHSGLPGLLEDLRLVVYRRFLLKTRLENLHLGFSASLIQHFVAGFVDLLPAINIMGG